MLTLVDPCDPQGSFAILRCFVCTYLLDPPGSLDMSMCDIFVRPFVSHQLAVLNSVSPLPFNNHQHLNIPSIFKHNRLLEVGYSSIFLNIHQYSSIFLNIPQIKIGYWRSGIPRYSSIFLYIPLYSSIFLNMPRYSSIFLNIP